MMTIGTFAQLSGFSVKALRRYDEQDVFSPAAIDPGSGYRRYTTDQLPAAIRLRALRSADVGLAEARTVVQDPTRARSVAARHRERLAAERARQDAALAALDALLDSEERGWLVRERSVPAQPWAGISILVDETDDATDDARADEAFTALFTALAAENNPPTGPFWTALGATDAVERTELLCCWPVDIALPADWSIEDQSVCTGVRSAGTELFVHWLHDEPIPTIDGAAHPAVLALLAEAERRGHALDLSGFRQAGVIAEGANVGTEVSIPMSVCATNRRS